MCVVLESTAQITIDSRSFHAVVQLPVDEIDLLLRLDRDLDGKVDVDELQAARDKLRAYVAKHIHVAADGTHLPLSVGEIRLSPPAASTLHLETTIDGRPASRIGVVSIEADFLTELSSARKTTAEIRIGDRAETFVFQRGAVYERRLTADFVTSALLVAAAALVIGALWFGRRRRTGAMCLAFMLIAAAVRADVIMSAPALNATLKTMERLTRQAESQTARDRANALFQLGIDADRLAALMNLEVESHGMQERELLDLALSRTKELGIAIAYNRDKKKFFYDGAAFQQYLSAAPRGVHAADAEFTLLAYQFYQSDGSDVQQVLSAAAAKKRFLAGHPAYKANAELSLYLAIDYRDAYRHYRDVQDVAAAEKFRRLTRAEYRRIVRQYAGTEQASSARQLLQRFDEETRQ